jgi:hypothetical protein
VSQRETPAAVADPADGLDGKVLSACPGVFPGILSLLTDRSAIHLTSFYARKPQPGTVSSLSVPRLAFF